MMNRNIYQLTEDAADITMGPLFLEGTLVYLNEWSGDWVSVSDVNTGEQTFVHGSVITLVEKNE